MTRIRINLRRGLGLVLGYVCAGAVVAGGADALAQDAGAVAAQQAVQQSVQASVQAAQQANDQMQQATQIALQQAQQAQQAAMNSTSPPRSPGLSRADKPTFLPKSGKYTAGTTVAIRDDIPKATIYYTTDGSEPTMASAVYQGPIALGASMQLRAIAKSPIYAASRVANAKYVVK